jgi:hypothetical protein
MYRHTSIGSSNSNINNNNLYTFDDFLNDDDDNNDITTSASHDIHGNHANTTTTSAAHHITTHLNYNENNNNNNNNNNPALDLKGGHSEDTTSSFTNDYDFGTRRDPIVLADYESFTPASTSIDNISAFTSVKASNQNFSSQPDPTVTSHTNAIVVMDPPPPPPSSSSATPAHFSNTNLEKGDHQNNVFESNKQQTYQQPQEHKIVKTGILGYDEGPETTCSAPSLTTGDVGQTGSATTFATTPKTTLSSSPPSKKQQSEDDAPYSSSSSKPNMNDSTSFLKPPLPTLPTPHHPNHRTHHSHPTSITPPHHHHHPTTTPPTVNFASSISSSYTHTSHINTATASSSSSSDLSAAISSFVELDLHSDEAAFKAWLAKKKQSKRHQRHPESKSNSTSANASRVVSGRGSPVPNPNITSGSTGLAGVAVGGVGATIGYSQDSQLYHQQQNHQKQQQQQKEQQQEPSQEYLRRRLKAHQAFLSWLTKKETQQLESLEKQHLQNQIEIQRQQFEERKTKEKEKRAEERYQVWLNAKREKEKEEEEKRRRREELEREVESRRREMGDRAFREWCVKVREKEEMEGGIGGGMGMGAFSTSHSAGVGGGMMMGGSSSTTFYEHKQRWVDVLNGPSTTRSNNSHSNNINSNNPTTLFKKTFKAPSSSSSPSSSKPSHYSASSYTKTFPSQKKKRPSSSSSSDPHRKKKEEYLSPPHLYKEYDTYTHLAPDYIKKYPFHVASAGVGMSFRQDVGVSGASGASGDGAGDGGKEGGKKGGIGSSPANRNGEVGVNGGGGGNGVVGGIRGKENQQETKGHFKHVVVVAGKVVRDEKSMMKMKGVEIPVRGTKKTKAAKAKVVERLQKIGSGV